MHVGTGSSNPVWEKAGCWPNASANSILQDPPLPGLAKAIWFGQVILNGSAKSIALQ